MRYLILILFLCATQLAQGQIKYDFDVKPTLLKKTAQKAESEKDYYTAIDYYQKYLIYKPEDFKAQFSLAEMLRVTRDYHKAMQAYENAYELETEKNILALYYKARMLMTQESYDEAIQHFQLFRKQYKTEKNEFNFRKFAKVHIEGCEMAIADSNIDFKTQIKHLGRDINKAYNEASPAILSEDEIIFASLRSDTIIHYNDSLFKDTSIFRTSFYVASKKNKEWTFSDKLQGPFMYNDFDVNNACFSLDKKRFYFTKCAKNWKFEIICNIYYSDLTESGWSEPVELNENINNKKHSSTHPSIGLNPLNGNEILYFSSNRKDGRGGFDLWYAESKKGDFQEARNLGGRINTEANEVTPFFDIETSSLYFSSNGHASFGELDVFRSFGNKSKWMKNPENMGKPFNSPADDLYFIHGESKQEGFIISNREGGIALKNPTCCDDLYLFEFGEIKRFVYKAHVLSDNESINIKSGDIKVFLRDPETSDTTYVKTVQINEEGKVLINVESDLDYLLIIESSDHFVRTLEIPKKGQKRDYSESDTIRLMHLSDQAFVLHNIYYDFDDWKLTKKAELAIDSFLLKILQLNQDIKVEISSHTDAKGSGEYNIRLSQKRAESVVMHLKKKGISSSRMVAKGYGKTKPIAPNTNPDGSDNPEGRQLNRRTEFKVIGFEQRVKYKVIPHGKNVK